MQEQIVILRYLINSLQLWHNPSTWIDSNTSNDIHDAIRGTLSFGNACLHLIQSLLYSCVCGVGGDDTQVTGKVYVMKDDVGRT
jgi:hypothetical protein